MVLNVVLQMFRFTRVGCYLCKSSKPKSKSYAAPLVLSNELYYQISPNYFAEIKSNQLYKSNSTISGQYIQLYHLSIINNEKYFIPSKMTGIYVA